MGELSNAIAELQEEKVVDIISQRLRAGDDPLALVEECRKGMDVVGDRFKNREYFLGELIVSSEIFKAAMALIEPRLVKTRQAVSNVSTVVLGTPRGDIHDIGKNIVAVLLRAAGFRVFDLGVDVPPQRFVEKLKETGAGILGMSGLITPSFEQMRETVKALEKAGLRDKVKVIIGGGIMTETVRRYVGADAYTNSAVEGIEVCKKLVREVKR